ncbi:MAG: tetratricopeptide repeat protein [Thermoanaerobaculia bacterium]
MKPLLISLMLLAAAPLPFLRSSNSEKLTRDGIVAFEEKDPSTAAQLFARAAEIVDSSRAFFNLGTSLVENGELEPGTTALTKASEEGGAVAADALFNRGNVALSADRLDEAIEMYAESLRIEPSMADAKRNLEIALRKKEQKEQQQQQQQDQDQDQDQSEQQPQEQPESGEQPPEGDDSSTPNDPGGEEEDSSPEKMSPEQILRSIAQQEREELSRMRRGKTEGRRPVGW